MSSPARGSARLLHGGAGSAHSSSSSSLNHSRGGSSRQALQPPTLQSDTVVFQHAKLPSRQSASTGTAPVSGSNSSSSQVYPGSRAASSSSASYSNTWSSSSSAGAPGAASQRASPGYHRYRDEQQDDRVPVNSGRDYDTNDRETTASRRHQYGNSNQNRRAPSANARAGADADHQLHQLEVESDGYANDDNADEDAGDDQETSFTNLLQDAVASTSPRSAQLQQRDSENTHRSQARTASAHAGGGNSTPVMQNGANIVRMTIRVMKEGNKLGFGIRHDSHRKLRVSTLRGNSAAAKSPLRLGDILLSVNGISLNDLGFLEVIQHLKATKPGELVFDIERDVNASPDHSYDYPDMDVGDEYLGEPASSYVPALSQGAGRSSISKISSSGPPSRQSSPQLEPSSSSAVADHGGMSASRNSTFAAGTIDLSSMAGSAGIGSGDQQRKRARLSTGASADVADLSKMEKTHKQVVNTLVLELKKEKAEKASLEDKNNALRKRLQKMLIECDEVRVKASTEVATVKENSKRVTQQLEKALAAAKAKLRLQDRGPDVARTDSIVNDLVACKAQLDRMKRIEADRSSQLRLRFNMENRHADREAHRVREKLVSMFRSQLRQVGKRGVSNPAPVSSSSAAGRGGAESANQTITVMYEGIRRMSFLKLFGFPHDYDQYTSPDFYSLAQIHRSLEHDEFADLFGSSLSHEERTGFFIVAIAPMDVAYDPSTECLSLVCGWTEQNTIRELARNFRF